MLYILIATMTIVLLASCAVADHFGRKLRKSNDEIDQAIRIANGYPEN